MKDKFKVILIISITILSLGIFGNFSLAGNENYNEGNHGRRGWSRVHGKKCSSFVTDKTYKNTCGECHMAYPPMLLPSSSWKKIMNLLENHFGEKVSVDSRAREDISRYLIENGADRSSCKKAAKIVKSLNDKVPVRITEVPYIRNEHREIPSKILEREKIGSLSNCLACHKKADQGLFNERDIKIPS
jgi:hypothetical protein